MASLPPSTIGFDLAAAVVSRWDAPPQTAPAGAARPTASVAEDLPLVLPVSGDLPRVDRADSFQSDMAADAAADPVFANLDAQPSLALFVDDPGFTPRN